MQLSGAAAEANVRIRGGETEEHTDERGAGGGNLEGWERGALQKYLHLPLAGRVRTA